MITRRIGAACETAHISAELSQPGVNGSPEYGAYAGGELGRSTLSVRFDSDRQKLSSPLQFPPASHWLKTLIAPLITTEAGWAPRPATWV